MQYSFLSKPSGQGYLSVDNIVVDYKIRDGQQFLNWLSSGLCLWFEYSRYECLGGIGKFREVFNFDFGQASTMTVMVGLFGPTGVCDTGHVRLDWNPNKCMCKEVDAVLLNLKATMKHVSIKRYDLAFDMNGKRQDYSLVRDNRIYEQVVPNTGYEDMTEYLGVRNTPGRFKLYNKTSESGLVEVKTRAELTCSGEWTPNEVIKHFPVVYERTIQNVDVSGSLSLREALEYEIIHHPEDINKVLALIEHKMRPKIKQDLAKFSCDLGTCIDFLESDLSDILQKMKTYLGYKANA